eukprot:c20114_g3_i1.p1 GENE.c20114_g3_i1~~c20114_g3_i1.p1  ORF type:complete len:296 (-),score=135.54 c20114_g3_i1:84-971(-)
MQQQQIQMQQQQIQMQQQQIQAQQLEQQQQQRLSSLQPSEFESLSSGDTSDINGLPSISSNAAVSQFVAQAAQQLDQQRKFEEAELEKKKMELQLEEAKKVSKPIDPKTLKTGFGIHAAVPKLQKWLAAMNPMTYVAPTFTNPVAAQVMDRLSDPNLPLTERMRMQKLVSSPYMFNMLGNPAYADPKIWSGLVSGAAVPYPLRNTIMSQRTGLPGRIATTGVAMSDFDRVAMTQYTNHFKESPLKHLGPFTPNHTPRKKIAKIRSQIHQKRNTRIAKSKPTPHEGPVEEFDNDLQ